MRTVHYICKFTFGTRTRWEQINYTFKPRDCDLFLVKTKKCKSVSFEKQIFTQGLLYSGGWVYWATFERRFWDTFTFIGLRLRNYRAVAGNHRFSARLSVFACFVAIIQTSWANFKVANSPSDVKRHCMEVETSVMFYHLMVFFASIELTYRKAFVTYC